MDGVRTALSAVADRSAYTAAELVRTTTEQYAGGLVTASIVNADRRSMTDWETELNLLPSAQASAPERDAQNG